MEQNSNGIVVSVSNSVPHAWVEELETELATVNVEATVEWRCNDAQAGIEWLLPTAAMLAIPTVYLSAMAAEAGRDHYHAIKNAVVGFAKRSFNLEQTVIASTPGKVGPDPPGALTIAFTGEGHAAPIRFILPAEPEVALKALKVLFATMEDVESRREIESSMASKVASGLASGKLIAKFDEDSGQWKIINPMQPS